MASMFSNETSRFDFDESSGNLIDKIGTRDLTPVGTIGYNPGAGFARLNGTNAAFEYTLTSNGHRDFTGDVSEPLCERSVARLRLLLR